MVTVFSVPKPGHGPTWVRQANALASWALLDPGVEILVFGDGEGLPELAKSAGALHEPDVPRNEFGTPLLDGVFRATRERAGHDLLVFANADILLFDELGAAISNVAAENRPFLVVGESWDVAVGGPISFDEDWQDRLRGLPRRRRGAAALDWFAFPRDLYSDVPPFAVGRVGYDNWLVWRACSSGALVVDATPAVLALHQRHDYDHVPGGFEATRRGPEAAANWALLGDKSRLYTRYDATHVLTRHGLRRNLGAVLRLRERARKAAWKLRHGQVLPARSPLRRGT